MSGGRTRSSTTSRTTSRVNNSNTQINDNEGTVLNFDSSSGNNIQVIETDNEVVERSLDSVDRTVNEAFDFGDTALEESFDFGREAIKETQAFGKSVIEEAQEFGEDALSAVSNNTQQALDRVSALVTESNLGDAERTRQIIIAVLAGVTILAAIALLTRLR